MRVPDHLGHHDDPDDLPLLTESARVTAVEAMDHDRVPEVLAALADCLGEHGTGEGRAVGGDEDALREAIEADRDLAALLDADAPAHVVEAVSDLADRYRRPFPSLVRVRVEPDDPVDFVPGQYLSLRYDDTTRPYSVASSPTDDAVEFCVRRVPGGHLTPDLVDFLEPGDEVVLRGPYGEFTMEPPSTRDLVFLATGTGVAPFRSMIEYTFETGRDVVDGTQRDVWLFLGAAWEDDLPYRERFRELDAARENFHFVPTLSRERHLTPWTGETAYVQFALARHLDRDVVDPAALPAPFRPHLDADPARDVGARVDPRNAEVYACGITAMVTALADAARALGVPDEHVHYEGFG